MAPLITFSDKGLYCAQAKVYIDPWKSVDKALITHGHSDHARRGHGAYLCHDQSVEILKHRLGKIKVQGVAYEQRMNIEGIDFCFYPAGHVYGSAQIKVSNKKESWVVSGDYKLSDDQVATPFVPVPCENFITESTFGMPVFQWNDPKSVFDEINNWWEQNQKDHRPSILTAYSLGKAQRIIKNISPDLGPIITHSSIEKINEIIRAEGIIGLPQTELLAAQSPEYLSQALIICPPAALNSKKIGELKNVSIAVASGWMALRSSLKRRNIEKGFVLSDHADWNDLNKAVEMTGAENIFVTHGYTSAYTRWLRDQGYNAAVVETAYEGEGIEQLVKENA